jgi:hypothetical protein
MYRFQQRIAGHVIDDFAERAPCLPFESGAEGQGRRVRNWKLQTNEREGKRR